MDVMSMENQQKAGHGAGSDEVFPGVVITVSDRAVRGERQDKSGPLAKDILANFNIVCPDPTVISDGVDSVRQAVQDAIASGARVVFTTGGTGVAPRDFTPEACAPLIQCRLEGVEQAVLIEGLKHTPLAGLSRCQVGLSGRGEDAALIVNAPGSTGGVRDAASVVGPLVVHILGQLKGYDH